MKGAGIFQSLKGATLVEFALAVPVLLVFIIGMGQLGIALVAQTGLQHALAEGARVASVYPTPSNAVITAAVSNQRIGYDPAHLDSSVALITPSAAGVTPAYYDLKMRYTVPLVLPFINFRAVVLNASRRVYIQQPPRTNTGSSSTVNSSTGGTIPAPTSTTLGSGNGNGSSGGPSIT